MEVGPNQAMLAAVKGKIERLHYDYSQEMLPEAQRKTGPDTIYTVEYQILHSYGKEMFGELDLSAELFVFIQLGGAYLFFFDKTTATSVPMATSFLPAKGGYDWVESLGDSDQLTPEQRKACRVLAKSEKEKKKRWDEASDSGWPGDDDIPF
jgi:hypothetical protein